MLAIAMALSLAGNARDARAAFPGANGKIAFVSDREAGTGTPAGLYTIDADGSDRTRLTTASTDGNAESGPAWSADGVQIAFERGGDLFVINADGSGETNVTSSPGTFESDPAWSPDGTKLVFGRAGELFTIGVDGTNELQLTDHPDFSNITDSDPNWSPDGTKIAFASTRDDQLLFRSELYTMNADGTAETRLTNSDGLGDVAPNWSPDGTRIVWQRENPAGSNQDDIFVMNADGTGETRVPSGNARDVDPAWSPDGTKIVFQSENAFIFTVSPDGRDLTQVTSGAVPEETSDREPDWGSAGSEPPAQLADLSVLKSENFDPITAGEQLTYAISVFNGGPAPAANVTLADPLPAGVDFVNVTTTVGTCAMSADVVTCQLGSLAASNGAVVTIVVVPLAAGTLENTATATTASVDPNALNNSDSEQTTVEPKPVTPALSIGDATVIEGNSGAVAAVFTVTRTGGTGASTVDWSIQDGTSNAGLDYTDASGSISFEGDETEQAITVSVVSDTLGEANETFFVNLSNPTGATIADGQGTGTIIDDDASPPTKPLVIAGPCSDHGTLGDDKLMGDSAPNWICGSRGVDELLGLGGDDRLLGGDGDDLLDGGLGADVLDGGPGNDVIYAFGDGTKDKVDGGRGFDTCFCGPEDDVKGIELIIPHGK